MDFVAQLLKSPLHAVQNLVLAPLVKCGFPALPVGLALAQQHIGEHEELMGDGDNVFLHAPALPADGRTLPNTSPFTHTAACTAWINVLRSP